jgi:mRNA interferase MazF
MIKRGEIYWVNLDDARGYETKNIRPCLVVSNDTQNRIGKRIMIAPLTSNIKKRYPFEAVIKKLKSKVMLDQVRVITIGRLGKRVSWLIKEEMEMIDLALHIALGIKICPSK